ncbi:probable small intestine urate exporter isoform X2 [Notamacropus eugenii]|uniref:probable small intestine urate exporter isoform X2 n=1 Tax=Notamacropus eugenii TaxID=9315 RepID=UPI003B683FCF
MTSLMGSLEGANSGKRESTNPQEEEGKKQPHQQVNRFCSVRYAMAIMIHGCNLIIFTQISSLSIAIIAMVNHTGQSNQSNVSSEGYPGATPDIGVPVYDWSPEIQGLLLSAFIYGSLISTVPSGYFAGVLGGKKIAGFSMLICSILNLLIPLAADYGLGYLFVIRIVQGLLQGMNYSALSAFWPKWAPPLERTQLSTIGISGGIGCVYCIIWFSLVYDDPMNHPLISDSEKEYIASSMTEQDNAPTWSLPFKAMIKTMALWAILVSNICRFWLISNLTTSLPTLLDSMFDLDFEKNGFLSALPLITSWGSMTLGGYIADFLLSKKILRLITVRKLFTFLGMFFSSLFTVLVPYVDSTTAIVFLILASTMSTLCFSGFMINPLDIAPRYASFLMALGTTFMLISGLVSPVITGYFINQDATGWKNVFFLSSAINLLGMVFYLIFGQTDVQDWAREHKITRF